MLIPLLRGTSPSAAPDATTTATDETTPTANAAAEQVAWTSPPTQVFGGDCGAVLTADQAAAILTTDDVTTYSEWGAAGTEVWLDHVVVRHNGGLVCGWEGDDRQVRIVILPASAFPDRADGEGDCVDYNGCTVNTVANGYLFSGLVMDNRGRDGAESDMALALHDAFTAVAATQPAPMEPWSQRDGDWADNYDCSDLFDKGGIWGALDRTKAEVSQGDDDNWPTEIEDALLTGHSMTYCYTGDYGDSMNLQVLAGGSWIEDEVAAIPGAKDVTVDGADRAIEISVDPGEGAFTSLYVFHGPNVFSLSSYFAPTSTVAPAAAPLLAYLDGAPVPTSAPTAPDAYLTTAGYGDIKLGKPVPSSTTLAEWQQAYDDCGYWQTTDESGIVYTKERDGKVLEIEVYGEKSMISTKSGARIGTSRAELEELFPDAAHPEKRLYIVKDSLGQVAFDVDESGTVAFIRVLPAGITVQPTGGHGICD